jgi:hypothetical protein
LLVIKYSWNGSQIWTNNFEQDGLIQVKGAAVDSSNNLYLLADCKPYPQYIVFMYSSSGALDWFSNLTPASSSQSHGLALDYRQNVVVTGQINYNYTGYFSYLCGTFKVNTNGNPVWTNYYPQPPSGSSIANAIAIDRANNSYVTGYSPGTNSNNDIVTIKYDANGNQIWLQRYNGPGNGNDAGNAIAVDNNGNVYVTGYDTTTAGGTEMVTIKYSPVTLQRRSDGTVLLQAQGSPGESFDIQASSNLENWLDLGSVTANSNGLMQFTDSNAPNFNARFYVTSPQ